MLRKPLSSLDLSFLICKMETMLVPLPHKDMMRIKAGKVCKVLLGGSGVVNTVNNVGYPIIVI